MVKNIKALCLGIVTVLLAVAGCGRSGSGEVFAPEEDSLYITGDGTVTAAVIETYEEDYYSEDELRAYTENVIKAFHGPYGGRTVDGKEVSLPVSIKECTLSDGKARLLLDFKDTDTYLSFMEQYPDEESQIQIKGIHVSEMETAVSEGFPGEIVLLSADGKPASADSVKKKSRLHVARIEGTATIQTDGEIRYISEGVEYIDSRQVKTMPDTVSYIIFK